MASSSSSASSAAASTVAGGKTLVAVFSWSGNTLQVAERINEQVESDLFRIEPAVPYTTSYDEVLDVAQAEQQSGALPEFVGDVQGWGQYDTIFLGYPVWWYDAPQIIKSFAAAHDFEGKTVVPFCTSGGSQLSTTLDSINEGCAGATIMDGITIPGGSVASRMGDVDAWLAGLGL